MKQYLLPAIGVGLLFSSVNVLAANTSSNTAQMQSEIREINLQTEQLKKEVRALRTRLQQREAGTNHYKGSYRSRAKKNSYRVKAQGKATKQRDQTPFDHEVTITTSPLIGLTSKYNASDILEQASSMNEDLTLLQQHQQLDQYLDRRGYSTSRPIIEISGGLEGQIYGASGFKLNNETDKGITLSTAELDINALVSRWASAFMSIDYNNSPRSLGDRDPDSTLYLKRGFVTLGNLQRFPVYFTIGESYPSFGKFSSLMISTPVTQSMARVRDTTGILGFYKQGFYAQVYSFPGDRISGGNDVFKQGGVNAGYEDLFNKGKFDIGSGWITNIADSQGMQDTGLGDSNSTLFRGFGATSSGNALRHDVGAFDVHGELTYNAFTYIGEFITATRKFDVSDLSYDGSGADVKAMHLEIDYAFYAWDKPFTVGASYGQTWEALALNLPKHSYTADFQVSLWKNTLETIEYRHDKDFDGTANGRGATSAITGDGGTRNAIVLQLGAYF